MVDILLVFVQMYFKSIYFKWQHVVDQTRGALVARPSEMLNILYNMMDANKRMECLFDA